MLKIERHQMLSFAQTLTAVLVGGIISYFTVLAQSHIQARTEHTTAAYAAYVEALSEFAQAVATKKLDWKIGERMAAARGRIAIYGTQEVIAALPAVGSLHDDNVRNEFILAIQAMRQDVGEEPVDKVDLKRLVFGNKTQPGTIGE